MSNQKIRVEIFNRGLRNWQIAKALGIHEATLSRWLREELTPERREKVLAAIEALSGKAVEK